MKNYIICFVDKSNRICLVNLSEWKCPYIGQFFTINELKKSYIIIPCDKYLSYLSGIVHEFAHMINSIYTDYQAIDDDVWNYVEVISLFMELLFKDYLVNMKIVTNEDYYIDTMFFATYTNNRAKKIHDCILLNKAIGKKTDITKIKRVLDNKKINFDKEYIKELLDYPAGHEQLYINNYLVALNLLYQHRKKNNAVINIKALAKMKTMEDLRKININFKTEEMVDTYAKYVDDLKEFINH